ncbi:MAG: hypothetical protein NUV54_00760 [Candidatus Taylorbacteria bacterium]|nr:hypothetical protein [Candidatus Taylorbacteria bacterium]
MFLGTWISTRATAYAPRLITDDEDPSETHWTHWKFVVQRGRYSDQASLGIDLSFFLAKRARGGGYSSKRKAEFTHHVTLGNTNYPWDEVRLRTRRDHNKECLREIQKELDELALSLRQYVELCRERRLTLDFLNLEVLVRKACWKPEAEWVDSSVWLSTTHR